jgi:hypothetical protein
MSEDPLLIALIDDYGTTLERLQRSFVGPPDLQPPDPVTREQFARPDAATAADGGALDHGVAAFCELQRTARSSAGIASCDGAGEAEAYRQYREWLPFAYRNQVILGRIADALAYDLDEPGRLDPAPTQDMVAHP